MKKQILIAMFALVASTSSLAAVEHNLKNNGMAVQVVQVYDKAENKEALSPIIKTYYDRIQQGQYDISIGDLQKLHEELSTILSQKGKHQI